MLEEIVKRVRNFGFGEYGMQGHLPPLGSEPCDFKSYALSDDSCRELVLRDENLFQALYKVRPLEKQ